MRSDPHYVHYRAALDDPERMKAHAEYRDRVFLAAAAARLLPRRAPQRPGFEVLDVREETIEAA